ncbi:MAG: hypothetical protein HQK98_07860 [Nitrospirae bacterium]|nr:hypothetical protein [Nitrospirota bacterium]
MTQQVTKERIQIWTFTPTYLAHTNIKDVVVWNLDQSKQYQPYQAFAASESISAAPEQYLQYPDVQNVKIWLSINKYKELPTNEYTIDTATGKLSIKSGSQAFNYDSIWVEYQYIERNYTVDAANGSIKLPQKQRDIVAGQTLYIDYKWTESTIQAGGYLIELQDEWIGDKRLHWYVSFKGTLCWLKCSDFVDWKIGDRVLILKGGLGTVGTKSTISKYIMSARSQFLDHKNVVSFKVQNQNKTVTYQNEIDYTIDRENGIFAETAFSSIATGWLWVEYTYTEESYIKMHKCWNKDGSNQTPQDDILSDSSVAYTLNRTSDIILPIRTGL